MLTSFRRPRCHTAGACGLALTLALIATAPPADACAGDPPPPRCAKTLVVATATPRVLLLTGGGSFDVDVAVYFAAIDVPQGTGICPAGPFTVDVSFTVTCSPGPNAAGTVLGVPIVQGWNDFSASITVPAGPQRLCSITTDATTTLADGMVLTAHAPGAAACIVNAAPGLPTEPRLDFFSLDTSAVAFVHPGDQAAHTYRIINNDPTETFTGLLTVDMVNTSRRPGMSGPTAPGTGVFALSDPGPGDNFPIGFPGDLFEGCLPLPPDPFAQVTSTIDQDLILLPGQSIDVPIFSRPWGMCSDGSCGQASLVLDGTFSDVTDGLACAGMITAADIGAPPQYLWPTAGATASLPIPPDPFLGVLTLDAQPLRGLQRVLDVVGRQPQLLIGGIPAPGDVNLFSHRFNQERGRTQVQWQDPGGLFPVASPFDLFLEIDLLGNPGGPPIEPELVQLDLVGGPTGLEQIAPVAGAQVAMRQQGSPDIDSFLALTFQWSVVGVDNLGTPLSAQLTQIDLLPRPDGTGFALHLQAVLDPGPGPQVQAVELRTDLRGFAAESLIEPLIFRDGFESGNTSAWSLTTSP